MSDTQALIAALIARCGRVAGGGREVQPLFGSEMPFGGNSLDELDLLQRTAATAFLKRFEQLQDLLARLARTVAVWEGVDVAAMSHRDVADWLEKRALVPDAATWMTTLRLRNRLVHEYPIEDEEQVRRLNECWTLMPVLYESTSAIADYAARRGYLP